MKSIFNWKTSDRGRRKEQGKGRSLMRKIGAALLAVAMTAALLPGVSAYADTSYPSSPSSPATIPVEQTVTSGTGTFTYTLTPEDESAPMPDNAKDGKYVFSIKNNGTSNIVIGSASPGTWYYTLALEKQDGFKYDTTKYRLGIQYVNDGGTLKANINALADGATADRKAAKVDFKITAGAENAATSKGKTGTSAPSSSSSPSRSGTVKTGDYSQTGLYIGSLLGAAALLVILGVVRRRKAC